MKQVYIKKEGREVYVVQYNCNKGGASLLIFPTLGWYHIGPNRIFIEIANLCNESGINVFCFDYIGSGESSGIGENISWDLLMNTCRDVYEYVSGINLYPIFIMGMGIGNLLLRALSKNIVLEGAIYYLPEFDIVYDWTRVFKKKQLKEMEETGQLVVEVKKGAEYLFLKAIVGPFHDCTYNPILYSLLKELSCLERMKGESHYISQLVIDDKVEKSVYEGTTHVYVSEFRENIIPIEWYTQSNLWPDTLYKVNLEIVNWLKGKLEFAYQDRSKKPQIICQSTKMLHKNNLRELVSIESGEFLLPGIIHRPIKIKEKLPCAIFLPGLGGDKVDNYTCGPRLGELLSDNDIILFRYDNRYSGISKNSLTNYNFTEILEDFHEAYKFLESYADIIDFNQISLIAWSAGAKIANYILSNKEYEIKCGCYWNPVFLESESRSIEGGNAFLRNQKYRKNAKGEYVTQIGGEYIGLNYSIDNKKYNFKEAFESIQKPLCMIWGKHDIVSEEYQYIHRESGTKLLIQNLILDSTHHLFSYESLEDVHELTLKWINNV